ncbi:MAG: 3-octaprenyl-4-hydroxybenzoate carboxy-lyase, partial [Sediminibacterium sp.]|nr:3-octaprenyl-4-hydroxybenzoate carboxy-lyase [Sediminibacterium sp.]
DYSGTGLNTGSKVVFAAYGEKIRELATEVPSVFQSIEGFENAQIAMPGVLSISTKAFTDYTKAKEEMKLLNYQLIEQVASLAGIVFIVVCDDSAFVAANMRNYLWVTYTRCNPSHDIYGIDANTENKHWGCNGPLVIDARIKPHHAPVLVKDPTVEKQIDRFFAEGESLHKIA